MHENARKRVHSEFTLFALSESLLRASASLAIYSTLHYLLSTTALRTIFPYSDNKLLHIRNATVLHYLTTTYVLFF